MIDLRNYHITVLKGGPGSERDVSLASGAGVEKALADLGAQVTAIDVRGPDFPLPVVMDIAFNIIHGTFGEDGQLQQILEDRSVFYTGEGVEGSRLAFDKILAKERFVARDVPTAAYEIIPAGGTRPAMDLPYVVKAPRQGSSVGIAIVKKDEDIDNALAECGRYDQQLLVEKFVGGRELTVGVLGDQALPIIEIVANDRFYDFKEKYPFLTGGGGTGGAKHFCPAPLDDATTQRVQAAALAAHRALDLQVYSRVDVLLPESGDPVVLEVNTIPGMTPSSLLPEAAAAAGIGYGELCARIVELSLEARKK